MNTTRRSLLRGSLGAAAALALPVPRSAAAPMIGIDLAAGPASTAITMLQVGAGKSIHIGTIVQIFDLRGEDPDRAMVAWVEPIERLARQQGASAI